MVTHSSTSRPVQCLCMAERTKFSLPNFADIQVSGTEFRNLGIESLDYVRGAHLVYAFLELQLLQ